MIINKLSLYDLKLLNTELIKYIERIGSSDLLIVY